MIRFSILPIRKKPTCIDLHGSPILESIVTLGGLRTSGLRFTKTHFDENESTLVGSDWVYPSKLQAKSLSGAADAWGSRVEDARRSLRPRTGSHENTAQIPKKCLLKSQRFRQRDLTGGGGPIKWSYLKSVLQKFPPPQAGSDNPFLIRGCPLSPVVGGVFVPI